MIPDDQTPQLDDLDMALIRELQIDGRQSIIGLASKTGASRPTVRKRLDRLLRQNTIRVTAVPGDAVMAHRTSAYIGLNVRPHRVKAVAERLVALRNAYIVSICAGRYDILVWAAFRDTSRLSDFVMHRLNKDPDILRSEVMVQLQTKKAALAYLADGTEQAADLALSGTKGNGREEVDALDLKLIGELQIDGRQSISILAKKVGVSRDTVRKKLERLLERRIIRVLAQSDPVALGYHSGAMLGINTEPAEVESVAERLASYQNLRYIAICAGRYDIIAWALCRDPRALSHLIVDEIGSDPNIVRSETMINLDMKKYLAFDSGIRYSDIVNDGPEDQS